MQLHLPMCAMTLICLYRRYTFHLHHNPFVVKIQTLPLNLQILYLLYQFYTSNPISFLYFGIQVSIFPFGFQPNNSSANELSANVSGGSITGSTLTLSPPIISAMSLIERLSPLPILMTSPLPTFSD